MDTSAEGIISIFIQLLHFIPPVIILKIFRSQVQYKNTFSTIIVRNINCMHCSNSYQEILFPVFESYVAYYLIGL